MIRRRALLPLSFALAMAAAPPPALRDGDDVERPLPHAAIALFWAEWCAPCQIELRDLPALQAAANPMPVIVVALDRSSRSRAMLRRIAPTAVRFPAHDGDDVLQLVPGGSAGVPAAIAFDRHGTVCASRSGAVSRDDMTAWRDRCMAR